MRTITAKLEINGKRNLTYIDPMPVNNGRNDGINFYVNNDIVRVYCWHTQLTEQEQVNLLNWFLDGYNFTLVY